MSLTTQPNTTTDNGSADLHIDDLINALSKGRRRALIDTLYEDGGGSFSEVVDGVSRRVYGVDYSSDERKRIYVSLYQNHVPRLSEFGVVVFEGTGDDERLYPGPNFRVCKTVLDSIRTALDRPEQRFQTLRDLL